MRTRFIILSGLRWGAIIWLALIVPQAVYELCFGSLSFTWNRLGFALYSVVFCFAWGCILGLLRDKKVERDD